MEYFDVFDGQGNKTETVKLREDVHRDGDWHKTIHVWIFNSKGEVLLQKRAPQKDSCPNMWSNAAGGHLESGEINIDTAIREIREELGINVSPNDLQLVYIRKYSEILNEGKFINNEFVDVYLLTMDLDVDQLSFDQSEISEFKFMGIKEYESKIKSGDSEYISQVSEFEKVLTFLEKKNV